MITRLLDLMKQRSKKPWAIYQTGGFDADGRIKFEISFNTAFIQNLKEHGIAATTDQEAVMLFLVASQMLPEEMMNDSGSAAVRSSAHPLLQSDKNIFREG